MTLFSNLLTHAVAWSLQGLRWLVVLIGQALLAIERLLSWLDSAHPLATFSRPLTRFVQRHPKRITAVLASLMMAGGGGAFAVANLGPDAADLPVSVLTEPITVGTLEEQAKQLDLRDIRLLRSDTTRSSDTPESLMRRLGLTDPEAARFLRQDPQAREALGSAGRAVSAQANEEQQLTEMTVRWLRNESDTQFQRWVLSRSAQGLSARLETVPMNTSIRMSGGTVSSTLYAASDEARLPDSVVSQLSEIFSKQIDFHGLRKGTRFAVVYEVLEADGEPLRAGKVLSAEFISDKQTYQAVWFKDAEPKGEYFTLDGKRLDQDGQGYLASPLTFSKQTSGFSVRQHPINGTIQEHKGIDYAAPPGTPVHAIGAGTVEFAGVKGGYGNVVILRHNKKHATLYAHLSRIDAKQGQTVTPGQVIGAVGSTGWSTGPHLHFEFQVNGVHVDPQAMIQSTKGNPIAASVRPQFNRVAAQARAQLLAAAQMRESAAQ